MLKRPPIVNPTGHQNKKAQSHKHQGNARSKGKKPSFHEIQEWQVVLGDMQCRKGRTTVATRMLRQVKKQFKAKHYGSRRKGWIPTAIEHFYARLRQHFSDSVAQNHLTTDQIGQVLSRCTLSAMCRIQDPNIYGYKGDSNPQFGTVKSPEDSLTFFLKSRDAPNIPRELNRHERELAQLRASSSMSPTGELLLQEFAELVSFFQQRVANADQGNAIAQVLLEELNLIPTLKKVSKCLKEQEDIASPVSDSVSRMSSVSNQEDQQALALPDWHDESGDKSVGDPFPKDVLAASFIAPAPISNNETETNPPFAGPNLSVASYPIRLPFGVAHGRRDLIETNEYCIASVYQGFQRDVESDIFETLPVRNCQQAPWCPPQGIAMEPPVRVGANQGMDAEPSFEVIFQEPATRDVYFPSREKEDVPHEDMDSGLNNGAQNGTSNLFEEMRTWQRLPNDCNDLMCQPFQTSQDTGTEPLLENARVSRFVERGRTTVGDETDNNYDIPGQETLAMDNGVLQNACILEMDPRPVSHFDRSEARGISLASALPIPNSELGRVNTSETSVSTAICVEAPVPHDWQEERALPTNLVNTVSDSTMDSREQHESLNRNCNCNSNRVTRCLQVDLP